MLIIVDIPSAWNSFERSLCICVHCFLFRAHQLGIDGRLQRYHFSLQCLHTLLLFYRYKLRDNETCLGTTTTSTKVVSREIWSCNQHYRAAIHHPALVLCILATCPACYTHQSRLGSGALRWHDRFRTFLLFYLGEKVIHRPCRTGEERVSFWTSRRVWAVEH